MDPHSCKAQRQHPEGIPYGSPFLLSATPASRRDAISVPAYHMDTHSRLAQCKHPEGMPHWYQEHRYPAKNRPRRGRIGIVRYSGNHKWRSPHSCLARRQHPEGMPYRYQHPEGIPYGSPFLQSATPASRRDAISVPAPRRHTIWIPILLSATPASRRDAISVPASRRHAISKKSRPFGGRLSV